MSRIGKMPINAPSGVKVSLADGQIIVEGPKGTLRQKIRPEVSVKIDGQEIKVERKSDNKACRSFHGLYRTLIHNLVIGVSKGFTKTLLINGIGYRAEIKGDVLTLSLGYSQPIEYQVEKGLTITCEGNNKIFINGIDKQRVGQVAADLRSLRPPEPYKGKGIRYEGEEVRRKIGKAGVK